jgi:hypothetical protein
MKKLFTILLIASFTSCSNSKTNAPDVSDIKVNVTLERFDKDFFSIDSNNVLPGLSTLNQKYPWLTPVFLTNILGLDSASTLAGVRQFIHVTQPIHDTVDIVFKDMSAIEKQFGQAFKYVKYYFPQYKLPRLNTVIGPIDALAQLNGSYTPNFLGPDVLGLSLQFYLGKNFSAYSNDYFIENVAPTYRSARFSKEYIIADAMTLIVDDIAPDQSKAKPLVEQMIEKGKQWWLLDKFLPGLPDSIKTGYRGDQVEWCKENEGMIWNYIIKNEDLNSVSPITIQTYIGEGPFTQGMPQESSPGNLGPWIGWQIIKKFESKNTSLTPTEILKTDAKTILAEAKYRPK